MQLSECAGVGDPEDDTCAVPSSAPPCVRGAVQPPVGAKGEWRVRVVPVAAAETSKHAEGALLGDTEDRSAAQGIGLTDHAAQPGRAIKRTVRALNERDRRPVAIRREREGMQGRQDLGDRVEPEDDTAPRVEGVDALVVLAAAGGRPVERSVRALDQATKGVVSGRIASVEAMHHLELASG